MLSELGGARLFTAYLEKGEKDWVITHQIPDQWPP